MLPIIEIDNSMSNTTWLNVIKEFLCSDCNYEWIAPSYGNCPKCSSMKTILKANQEIHLGPVRVWSYYLK